MRNRILAYASHEIAKLVECSYRALVPAIGCAYHLIDGKRIEEFVGEIDRRRARHVLQCRIPLDGPTDIRETFPSARSRSRDSSRQDGRWLPDEIQAGFLLRA